MDQTIKHVVAGVGLPALKNLRTRLGIGKGLVHKDDLVTVVVNYLANNLDAVVQQLSPMEKKLLAEIAHSKGGYDPEVFRAKYPGWHPSNPSYSESRDASLTWLFFTFFDKVGYVMPPALASKVRGILTKPAQAQVTARDEIPTEVADKEFGSRPVRIYSGRETSLIELKQVLGLANAGKLRIAPKSKRPTGGAEKVIGGVLIQSDFNLEIPEEYAKEYSDAERAGGVRSHAWAVLVQQCGWCKACNEKLVLTEAGMGMLTLGRMEDFRQGVERFIDDDDFDELHRVNHIRGQTGRAKRYMTRPSSRRSAILGSMSDWPPERWVSIDEVHRFVRASGRELETCRQPLYLYFGEFQYGHLTGDAGVSRQYLRALLLESLGTLGLVDLAYVFPHYVWPDFRGEWGTDEDSFTGRYDGLLYVRLNQLGAYCLGLIDQYEASPRERAGLFRVLPNHEIVLSGHENLTPSDAHWLNSIAAQTADLVWKIDRDVILGYLESGGSPKDIREFLDCHAVDGVPEQVSAFLADITRKAQTCRSSEEAMLIELGDRESAAEITNDSRASKLCQLVGASSVVVRKRNLKAFQNALRKIGYVLPK
jgi:hypothetical protein